MFSLALGTYDGNVSLFSDVTVNDQKQRQLSYTYKCIYTIWQISVSEIFARNNLYSYVTCLNGS